MERPRHRQEPEAASPEPGLLAVAPSIPAAAPLVVQPPVLRRWPPAALSSRTFRWYWLAQWPTLLGTWMQVVALGYLVFDRTHSSGAVAAVAAADGLPAVLLSLAGGLVADRVPRRRILLVTQSVLGLSSAALAGLAVTGHATFWAIVAIAVVYGSADAIDLPARQALVADLVDRDRVVSAVALTSTAMSATRIVGPSLAGLLIATAGPGVCFAVLAAAYVAPLAVLLRVIPNVPPHRRRQGATALGEMIEALATVRRDPLVRGVVVAGGVLALLGVSYMPFLPVLARTQLHGGPEQLGLMYSIGGIGGVVGGVVIAAAGGGARRRALLVGGGLLYAVSLFTVARSALLPLTLIALVLLSFAFLAMSTSMTTLLQTDTDPRLRGRLLGVYAMLFAGLQPLGTLAYAGLQGPLGLFPTISWGALVVGGTVVAVGLAPGFRTRVGGAPPPV